MKQQEVINEIQRIIDELVMDPREFALKHNIETYDPWAYRTGWCEAKLALLKAQIDIEGIERGIK